MMPKRIQRKRTKGWRLPTGAMCVDRSTRWGNPYRLSPKLQMLGPLGPENEWWDDKTPKDDLHKILVERFEHWLSSQVDVEAIWIMQNLNQLRGNDLACWCDPSLACHADVLIEIANR